MTPTDADREKASAIVAAYEKWLDKQPTNEDIGEDAWWIDAIATALAEARRSENEACEEIVLGHGDVEGGTLCSSIATIIAARRSR